MKAKASPSHFLEAFTFVELLVVLAIVLVLAGLIAPALGASKARNAAAGCLNNLGQLQIVWRTYMGDNNDVMLPAAPFGENAAYSWDNGRGESWTYATGNTNVAAYASSLIGPYIRSNVLVRKCPADVVPSRLVLYTNGSDLVRPSPANAFIFLDEHPASINDAYFRLGLTSPIFPDVPASLCRRGMRIFLCGWPRGDSSMANLLLGNSGGSTRHGFGSRRHSQ